MLFLRVLVVLLVYPSIPLAKEIKQGNFSLEIIDEKPWVSPFSLNFEHTPSQNSEYGSIRYILIDDQVFQDKDNSISTYYRQISQPLNPSGVDSFSSISISFNSEYQKLFIHDIKIYRDGEEFDRINGIKVKFSQNEPDSENLIYTGLVTANIFIQDLRTYDIIEYSYSIEGRNPIYGSKFFSSRQLQWGVPVENIFVKFITPKEKKIKHQFIGQNYKIKKSKSNGFKQLQLHIEDQPGLIVEDDYPEWHFPYPWISVSEYKNWNQIAKWGVNLYTKDTTKEIKIVNDKINEIWIASKDKFDYAKRSLKFIQDDIRYLSLSLGKNTHFPHSPTSVLNSRYGDCKDKSNLLVHMLNKKGIEAYPALVSYSNRGEVDLGLPSPGVFDHVITVAKIKGREFWFDPTRSLQEGDIEFRPISNFKKALVLNKNSAKFSTINLNFEKHNKVEMHETFRSDLKDLSATLDVTTKYHGLIAEYYRRRFSSSSKLQLNQEFQQYYSEYYDGIELKEMSAIDNPKTNSFSVRESYTIPGFWKEQGNQYVVSASFYHTAIRDRVKVPTTTTRKTPLSISQPVLVENKLSVKLPKDVELNIEEPPKAINTQRFNYNSRLDYSNGDYEMITNLSIKDDFVTQKEMKEFKEYMSKIKDDTGYSLTVNLPKSAINYRFTKKLTNSLEKLMK